MTGVEFIIVNNVVPNSKIRRCDWSKSCHVTFTKRTSAWPGIQSSLVPSLMAFVAGVAAGDVTDTVCW